MNFKQLEAFLRVAELQSFTRAARQLYMSQPAVSFQIKALEDDLRVPLFQRGDKQIIMTEAGRLLYPEAKQMVRQYHMIRASLDDLRGLKTGHLLLGASTIPGEYLMPVLVGEFRQKYPGMDVNLRVGGSGDIIRLVRDREIDLGITGIPVSVELECKEWQEDRLVLIVPQNHPWCGLEAVEPAQLVAEPMIVREPGSGTRRTVESKLADLGYGPGNFNIAMELGSTRAVITGVQAGLGVSIVSWLAAQEALELGKVCSVGLRDVDLSRKLYLIRYPREVGSFAVDAFIKFILEQADITAV
jgi:DNA-binding transcriptional LysR family regulator